MNIVSLPTGAKTAIQADAVASLVHLLKGGRPEAQLSAANSLRLLAQHLRTATGCNLLLMSGVAQAPSTPAMYGSPQLTEWLQLTEWAQQLAYKHRVFPQQDSQCFLVCHAVSYRDPMKGMLLELQLGRSGVTDVLC